VICVRKATFTAAHTYFQPHRIDPGETARLFGAAARPSPHGHDYRIELSVSGEIGGTDGMVVNLVDLKAILRETVVDHLDHRFLNEDVPHFARHAPSSENLLAYLWPRIEERLPPRCRIERLVLRETDELSAELVRKEGAERLMLVTRTYDFSASHRLHSPLMGDEDNARVYGKCNRPNGHGHNYGLEVTVRGPVDERTGIVLDIALLDRIVNEEVIDRYDHRHLNHDVPDFAGMSPTSENVARAIFARLVGRIPRPAELHRIRLHETARNVFECRGED
jgi:6-pyruvoyltetrahydropterin/6-carboxytetrahydropterin synthase